MKNISIFIIIMSIVSFVILTYIEYSTNEQFEKEISNEQNFKTNLE